MQIRHSKALEQLLAQSLAEARRMGLEQICPDRIFLGMAGERNCHAFHILQKLLKEWELHQVKTRVERDLAKTVLKSRKKNDETTSAAALCERMETVYNRLTPHAGVLNTGHLLVALLEDRSLPSTRALESYHVSPEAVTEYLVQLPAEEDFYEDLRALERMSNTQIEIRNFEGIHPPGEEDGYYESESTGTSPRKSGRRSSRTDSVLEKHATNLTRAAADGEIDPVVGREQEIERLIQILGRRKKNNPILIGEAGVGKSAIVEGLALRIARREVPHSLRGKTLYSLDVTSLVAGTKYRGQFEERIQALLSELTQNRDIILFIDEIHTIVGAGSTQGSLDTANILKPALARGELQCIGATTLDEYRESIESDSALERRFQKILVEPTTKAQTLEILRNIKPHYEKHHYVHYTEEALRACVELTERYITDRQFPDKAIDVLDEAGSKAHIFQVKEPALLGELESRIEEAGRRKREAIERQEYEQAAEIRIREVALKNRLTESRAGWQRELAMNPVVVRGEHIEQVITSMTGIPVEKVSQGEQARLRDMERHLGNIVIGQESAVEKVTRSILRSRSGLKDPDKPIGVFMFVGPTGVGKTHLAKELSRWLFDRKEALVRVDMSEYSEKHNVSRLIGSPPGYVGYNEGGQLTESVRRQPYAVVLFDEIEKAHPDVFNIMLQIFDDGQLTDGLGRKVDFRNTIIIMTSNVGSRAVTRRSNVVGYNTGNKCTIELTNREAGYRKALEETFAPEFINRIDDIVIFNTLSQEDVGRIVDLELAELNDRVTALGYRLEITPEAKARLAEMGYQARYGVRSLKRTILEQVEEPLAQKIVDGEIGRGDVIEIGCADSAIELLKKAV